jgi:hypothetical protein
MGDSLSKCGCCGSKAKFNENGVRPQSSRGEARSLIQANEDASRGSVVSRQTLRKGPTYAEMRKSRLSKSPSVRRSSTATTVNYSEPVRDDFESPASR